MKAFEPMLAASLKNGDKLRFPVLCSPKLDGVRGVALGQLLSRKLKPIPNVSVQNKFGSLLQGIDGELIAGDPTSPTAYRDTMSGVMAAGGEPDVKFYVFDIDMQGTPFEQRLRYLKTVCSKLPKNSGVVYLEHVLINDEDELRVYEEKCLSEGYEGAMARDPQGFYKYGRSTLKEGGLLKIKRFMDSEAVVLEALELEHNGNTATTNELGRTKRSSHKAGKVLGGVLGALRVRDRYTGVEFNIGSGFDDAEKRSMWADRENLLGKLVKYRYFPMGSKDKPRFPVFLGMRSELDV